MEAVVRANVAAVRAIGSEVTKGSTGSGGSSAVSEVDGAPPRILTADDAAEGTGLLKDEDRCEPNT